jgi:glutaconate CoA-transferase subunit A
VKGLEEKLMTPSEAVSRFIHNGAQIALGGFTITRNPMAVIHEVIRQKIRDLHVVCHSHGQGLDLLIGGGCVGWLEIAYAGNGRFAPTCVRFRKAVERGEIAFEDYSNFQVSLRFLAGALGIPFIPTKSGLGTDLLRKEGFSRKIRTEKKISTKKCVLLQNPFEEKNDPVALLPALSPDVALIHAQQVGEDGTVRIRGLTFADIEQAKSADAVIIFMQHKKRRFVGTLDYLTSPGWLAGDDSRNRAGLSRGGPAAVVSDLGIIKFHDQTKEMYLMEYYPASPRRSSKKIQDSPSMGLSPWNP